MLALTIDRIVVLQYLRAFEVSSVYVGRVPLDIICNFLLMFLYHRTILIICVMTRDGSMRYVLRISLSLLIKLFQS